MFDYINNSINSSPFKSAYRQIILTGIFVFLLGLIILFVPQIIVAFIATLFFLLGAAIISIGWQMRKIEKTTSGTRIHIY